MASKVATGNTLIKLLFSHGYTVHGTVRNHGDDTNADLKNLQNAAEKLELFKSNLLDFDSILAAVKGCNGVFHVANTKTHTSEHGESSQGRTKPSFADIVRQTTPSGQNLQLAQQEPQQPPTLLDLRLPQSVHEWPPTTTVFVFGVVLPKTHKLFIGNGWEDRLNKFIIHWLRLLNEPPDSTIVPYDTQMDNEVGSPLDVELTRRWPSLTYSDPEFRKYQWEKHGGKQMIFPQRDYFHNACVLHKHFDISGKLDAIAHRLGVRRIQKFNRWWRCATASRVQEELAKLLNHHKPILYCMREGGDNGSWFLYEIHLYLNSRLQLESAPPSPWFKGGVKNGDTILF